MKTKKYLIAVAIFGGVLFMAQSATMYNLDAEETSQIKRRPFKIPRSR